MPEQHLLGPDWENKFVNNVLGGLRLDLDSEGMQSSQFLTLDNVRYYKNILVTDTGYKDFANIVLGQPRLVFQHLTASSTANTFLISNLSFYRKSGVFWHVVPVQAATTIDANVNGGDTVIPVASTSGISAGNIIGLELDDGSHHVSTVQSISVGVSVTIEDVVPGSGVVATSGNAFVKGTKLSGDNDRFVDALSVPWDDRLVFTNGVDNVKYFDPLTGLVQDIPNLPSSGNTQCVSLALFDSSLVLVATIEGGANFNQRLRWSDRANITEWIAGEAGFIDLFDSTEKVLRALKLGPYLSVYREESIVRGTAVNNAIKRFDWTQVVEKDGLISPGGVVSIGANRHIGVNRKKVFEYKGGFDVADIGKPVESLLFGFEAELDQENVHKLFCVHIEEQREVFICYQSSEATALPDRSLRWDYEKSLWAGKRQFADEVIGHGSSVASTSLTWDDLVGSWAAQTWKWNTASIVGLSDTILLCTDSGQVVEYDYITPTDDGVEPGVLIETPDFMHPNGQLRHDYLEMRCAGGEITVSYSVNNGQNWQILKTIDPGLELTKVRLHKQFVGRSIRYRIEAGIGFRLAWYNIRVTLETEN